MDVPSHGRIETTPGDGVAILTQAAEADYDGLAPELDAAEAPYAG